MNAKSTKDNLPVSESQGVAVESPETQRTCGIIMPISDMDGYDPDHWVRIKEVIVAAASASGFHSRVVSESENIGVIHTRIVTNLHDDPVVVCDVSGKNANVMFELGLRLAFDKPAIIIIDEKTDYSFDTGPIEHIRYRSDMRYRDTLDFIKKLSEKISATYKKSVDDPNYSPFLKDFRRYKVADLKEENIPFKEYIDRKMESLQKSIERVNNKAQPNFKFDDKWDHRKTLASLSKISPSAESKSLVDTIQMLIEKGNYTSDEEAFRGVLDGLLSYGVDTELPHIHSLVKKQLEDHIFF